MSIPMYQASVPVLARTLRNLSAILAKAAAHAEQHKIDPAVLLSTRLFPDMFPLLRQVQIATDMARGAVARLAGVERPALEDDETTIDELQARLGKSIAFIESMKPSQIDGSEEKSITLNLRGTEVQFAGLPYLLHYALPNVYFHVTTAYAILRHCGVPLGKPDFIGGVPG